MSYRLCEYMTFSEGAAGGLFLITTGPNPKDNYVVKVIQTPTMTSWSDATTKDWETYRGWMDTLHLSANFKFTPELDARLIEFKDQVYIKLFERDGKWVIRNVQNLDGNDEPFFPEGEEIEEDDDSVQEV